MAGAPEEVLLAAERLGMLSDVRADAARTVLAGRPDAHRSTCLRSLVDGGVLDENQARAVRDELERIDQGIAKYRPGEVLGRGGMGVVVSASDPDLGREVAIKTMFRADDPAVRQRFLDEARVTGRLEHPNIVPVHELGFDAHGRPFLVMKRVRGRSLGQIVAGLNACPQPDRELIRLLGVFVKVCDAVAFAHSHRVLHRDLKPDNVMVGEFGEVLVMDWGLAKAKAGEGPAAPDGRAGDSTLTLEGEVLGTPSYMAPEQALGGGTPLDARTDVYGLGAVLYEILSRVRPFEAPSVPEILILVVHGELVPPSTRARGPWTVPRELEAVVLKAMARESRKRYPSVEALRDEVEAYLAGRRVAAAEYSSWELLAKWVRRNRTAVVTGAVAAFVLLTASVLFVVNLVRARRDALTQKEAADRSAAAAQGSRREAELRLAESQIRHGDALLSAGRPLEARRKYEQARADLARLGHPTETADLGIFDVNRRYPPPVVVISGLDTVPLRVAFLADGRRFLSGHADGKLALRDAWTGATIREFGGGGSLRTMALSHDGRVLTAHDDHSLRVWNTETGDAVCEFRDDVLAQALAWFPDGRRFAVARKNGTAVVRDAETGATLLVLRGNPWECSSVAISPDGYRIATGGTDKYVRLWDASTGREIGTPLRMGAYVTQLAFSHDGSSLVAGAQPIASVLDARSGRELARFVGHTGDVQRAVLTPDGRRVLTASADRTVGIWAVRTGKRRGTLCGHEDGLSHMDLSPRGDLLVTSSIDRTLRVWSLAEADVLRGHAAPPGFDISPDGAFAVSAGGDYRLRVWDIDGRCEVAAGFLPSPAWGVALLPGGATAAISTGDGRVLIWDLAEGVAVREFRSRTRMMTSVAALPGGRVAGGGQDGVVRIWDFESDRPEREIAVHKGWVSRILPLSGGRALTASADGTVKLLDLETGAAFRTFEHGGGMVLSVSVSPDESWMVTVGVDQRVRVWEIVTGRKKFDLGGPTTGALDAHVSSDGRRVVTCAEEGTVRLWEAATGRELRVFETEGLAVRSIRFLPDGARFMVALVDGSLLVFDPGRRGVGARPPDDAGERLAFLGASAPAVDLLTGQWERLGAGLRRLGRLEEAAEAFRKSNRADDLARLRAPALEKAIAWSRRAKQDAAPIGAGTHEVDLRKNVVRTLELTEGDRLHVMVEAEGFAPAVRIYLPDGHPYLAPEATVAEVRAPIDGTYLIVAGSKQAGEGGPARLTVRVD